MDFSLSSSLVGSAVSNPDKLALDLQFATDKTLTARKGPTPVFTQASHATFVNSEQLVKYAPNNLSLYSGAIVSGTGWLTSQVTSVVDDIGPDGNNAYTITEDTTTNVHGASNTGGLTSTTAMSVVSGITYTGSIFLKKITGGVDWVQLTFGGGGFGSAQYANFNISTGVVGNFAGSTATIEAFPNGWYRCRISVIASTTTTTTGGLGMFFTNNTNSTTRAPSYTGNASNKFLAAMCQFEIGSTISTYNPTTTAAFYGPRFDHDPVTGVCKGLLIEEQRTNNSWYSGAIVSGTGWLAAQITSVIDGVGPDGNNAYTLTEDIVTNVHAVSNTGGATGTAATSIVSGTVYTGSIFLKKVSGSVDWVQLLFGTAGFGATQYANFNLNTGTVGNSAGLTAGFPPRIEAFANGWYRCSITATATATTSTSNNLTVGFVNNNNGTIRLPSYAGSTASKVLAAMCQFELGSFPTSYIPTVAASVIRSADTCSISGSGFTGMWNAIEGSLSSSVVFNAPISSATGQLVVDVNDTTTANRLRYFRNPTTGVSGFANTSNSTTNVSMGGAVLQPFIMQKFSAGFKLDDYAFYVNNSQVAVDNLGALLVSPTTLTIGDSSAGAARQYTNGTISSIRYYKKRLPNAKLQAITV